MNRWSRDGVAGDGGPEIGPMSNRQYKVYNVYKSSAGPQAAAEYVDGNARGPANHRYPGDNQRNLRRIRS